MADGVEEFNWDRQMAKVAAGFKGGPMFQAPNLAPAVNIGEGWPEGVDAKMKMGPTETPTPTDAWNQRK